MTENAQTTIDWNNLDALPDQEIAALVEAARSVLQWSAEEEGIEVDSELPASARTSLLQAELAERGIDNSASAAEGIVEQEDSREIGIALLQQIAREPALALRVEEVYRERKRLLVVGAGVIAAAALLILVLKLKKVKIGNSEIDFETLSDGALKSVFGFLGKPGL